MYAVGKFCVAVTCVVLSTSCCCCVISQGHSRSPFKVVKDFKPYIQKVPTLSVASGGWIKGAAAGLPPEDRSAGTEASVAGR
jgi:hypothetical protein